MALNPELNIILKEMWRLDEKTLEGQVMDEKESEFYAMHLETIKNYYSSNSDYWQKKYIQHGNQN